jgi:hypothetical protein
MEMLPQEPKTELEKRNLHNDVRKGILPAKKTCNPGRKSGNTLRELIYTPRGFFWLKRRMPMGSVIALQKGTFPGKRFDSGEFYNETVDQ